MKTILTLSFLGFILCTAFDKPYKIYVSDYRDTYTGIYFCEQFCGSRSNSNNQTPNIIADTISIEVIKDVLDSVLQIKFGNQITKVKLINKTLQAFPNCGYYGESFFATDSIYFYIAFGRASSCNYKGKKK